MPTEEAFTEVPTPPQVPLVTFDVLAPRNGTEVNTDFISILAMLEFDEADGYPNVNINGEPAIMMENAIAYGIVKLEVGENTISVTAVDSAGSVVSEDISVTYNPPIEGTIPLSVFYPPNGWSIANNHISVIGGTLPDAEVIVNGKSVGVDADGVFITDIDVSTSGYTIDVEASAENDRGEEITSELSIRLEEFVVAQSLSPTPMANVDPTATVEPGRTPESFVTPDPIAPDLTTFRILSAAKEVVETSIITVLLEILDQVVVRVNGEIVEISEEGYAEADVPLTIGENSIEISSSNYSTGVSESTTLNVFYTPPSDRDELPLSVFYPSDGMVVTEPEIRLSGGTTNDATIEVGGRTVEVDDNGTFSTMLNLAVGENRIEITALDPFINPREQRQTLVVTLEDPALVGKWEFEEGVGTVATDSSTHGLDGTIYGGAQWITGTSGLGLRLDGEDDYVSVPYSTDIPEWTVSAWVRSPRRPSYAPATGPVFRDQNFYMAWNHQYSEFRGSAGFRGSVQWHSVNFGKLSGNKWYHLAATYDGEVLKAYTNGLLNDSDVYPSGPPDTEDGLLTFGRHSGYPNYFDGDVDEIRIYSRALTDEEIASLASESESDFEG
jgi:hypothetical protein